MDALEYLKTALKLLDGQPTQIDIRRSISTVYYALFHELCFHFGDIVLQPVSGRFERAWLQAYRYIDHGPAKQRCREATTTNRKFPPGIVVFAETFVTLQERRNEADYDPSQTYTMADAFTVIGDAIRAIAAFDAEPPEVQRAFVIFVGLRPRNR